jgi:hypothetical protein
MESGQWIKYILNNPHQTLFVKRVLKDSLGQTNDSGVIADLELVLECMKKRNEERKIRQAKLAEMQEANLTHELV